MSGTATVLLLQERVPPPQPLLALPGVQLRQRSQQPVSPGFLRNARPLSVYRAASGSVVQKAAQGKRPRPSGEQRTDYWFELQPSDRNKNLLLSGKQQQ